MLQNLGEVSRLSDGKENKKKKMGYKLPPPLCLGLMAVITQIRSRGYKIFLGWRLGLVVKPLLMTPESHMTVHAFNPWLCLLIPDFHQWRTWNAAAITLAVGVLLLMGETCSEYLVASLEQLFFHCEYRHLGSNSEGG